MQNEDISNKTITVTTRSAEKVLRFLAKHGYSGFKKMQNCHNQKKLQGKQSYKNICKSGQGLSVVDIGNSDEIKLFLWQVFLC